MIIAIDGYEANISHRVGIGRYAYEILKHLYALQVNEFARYGLKNTSSVTHNSMPSIRFRIYFSF